MNSGASRSNLVSVALLALLALGGCTLNDNQRDQVSDMASAAAEDAIADSQKVQELEDRIIDLEDRLDRQGIPY